MSEPLFPELKNLKGGKKQAWINEHLDVIVALNDSLDFDETAEILHMKANTLIRALRKAERKPVITESNKAISRAALNREKIDEVRKELHGYADDMDRHVAEDRQLLEYMVHFYRLLAEANTIMAELMSNVAHTRDLTYHI